jgi:integrase
LDRSCWPHESGQGASVPLAQRCIELLNHAKVLSASTEFVFPGRSNEKPMSNMVLLMTMRRMKWDYTAHGFRSAFRDCASERTNFAREICETALAHIVKDKTEAAYRRGDLFEKMRELMATWAAFIAARSAEVITLRRPR